jgi:hypothetical protein
LQGIQIHNASLEVSPAGLEALVRKEGAEVRVTKLDLSISPEALNVLLAGMTPEGETPPQAAVSEGRLQVSGAREGKRMALDLQVGGLRVELGADGVRLVSG